MVKFQNMYWEDVRDMIVISRFGSIRRIGRIKRLREAQGEMIGSKTGSKNHDKMCQKQSDKKNG